ncbi:LysR family hydrogen peroxide-inducible transcriptional activator [Litorivivens lipolytica]|uniref:LysR family hydrogen peroxide-inducible transcriptional activator n=1 Tax=Litorivivens lipolytica TaxID=1524264 RepID=A0A7W4W775_9GAMM|nr:LysR family hydrogen peroxide-inducible transcriptional activator [Litorivivens lipolytica]
MISLRQLQYALAVDKTRHFKRASEDCAISQSALSTAIAELETQLGIQIFERNNKQVLVTPQGEQLLLKARDIIARVQELYHLAESDRKPLSVPLSIGVIPTIGPYLLPRVLPRVRKRHPDSQLSIVEDQSAVLVEKVRSGELDTAILALPYAIEGLHAFEFWAEDFYLLTHRQDALAKRASVAGKQLRDSRLLLLKEGHCLKDHALSACRLPATETDQALAGTSLYTLVQMVAGKMGTTLVPAIALDQLLHNNRELAAIPLKDPGPHRRLAFITRLNFSGVNSVDYLRTLFREELQRKPSKYEASH